MEFVIIVPKDIDYHHFNFAYVFHSVIFICVFFDFEFLFFLQVKAEFSHGTPVSNFKIVVHTFSQTQELITDINGLANFTIDTSFARSAFFSVSVSFLFMFVCMLVLCRFADAFHSKITFDYVCVLVSCSSMVSLTMCSLICS